MPRTYQTNELREIGAKCSTRPPSAATVQAMFLYELNRDSEIESLFQGQLFRLDRTEDTTKEQAARLTKLEESFAQLKLQLERNKWTEAMGERLTKTETRMHSQKSHLGLCATALESQEERLARVEALVKSTMALKGKTDIGGGNVQGETNAAELSTIKEDVEVLFDERDHIVKMLEDIDGRIKQMDEKLQEISKEKEKPVTPAASQRLPVRQNGGAPLELNVPRGSPLVTLSENRQRRTVSPYKIPGGW